MSQDLEKKEVIASICLMFFAAKSIMLHGMCALGNIFAFGLPRLIFFVSFNFTHTNSPFSGHVRGVASTLQLLCDARHVAWDACKQTHTHTTSPYAYAYTNNSQHRRGIAGGERESVAYTQQRHRPGVH